MRTFEQFSHAHVDRVGRPIVEALWPRQPAWAVASISTMDAAFFAGLIVEIKPAKLVEIGVASGWGSCVLLEALRSAGLYDSHLHGIDIAERFFYDAGYATGQCVPDVLPDLLPRYHLATNVTAARQLPGIGGDIDFVFIDAHHMHPWATLDLLSVIPFVRPETWIAMHDLNLSRKEDQNHQNRGPKYVFEGWDHDKMHSIETPTMAGAVRVASDPSVHLPLILDILYTPWELPVAADALDPLLAIVLDAYGEVWCAKFRRAFEVGNYHVSKVHSPEIDRLQREIAALRSGVKGRWIRRLLGSRAA